MLINIYKISYVTNVIGKPSVRTSANENAHLDGQLFVDIVEEFVRPEDMQEERKTRKKLKVKVKSAE